eukprot:Gb_24635 [translate_table: standard]
MISFLSRSNWHKSRSDPVPNDDNWQKDSAIMRRSPGFSVQMPIGDEDETPLTNQYPEGLNFDNKLSSPMALFVPNKNGREDCKRHLPAAQRAQGSPRALSMAHQKYAKGHAMHGHGHGMYPFDYDDVAGRESPPCTLLSFSLAEPCHAPFIHMIICAWVGYLERDFTFLLPYTLDQKESGKRGSSLP